LHCSQTDWCAIMVATIDTAFSDSDDDVISLAKRAIATEGVSPAYKARRRSQDMHAMRHLQSSPKIVDGKITQQPELLEPSRSLEQRLRFVSPTTASGLLGQMQNMCIEPKQDSQQPLIPRGQETSDSLLSSLDAKGTREHRTVWRICSTPGSEKRIHTTEDDGWQIVEEYCEKSRPQHSPSPSPERTSTSITAPSQVLAPSKSSPVLSRSDTVGRFQWLVANLPYPESTYSVTTDKDKHHFIIKTSNRKYYKRVGVPELRDRGEQLDEKLLTWKYYQNTLTVSYPKIIDAASCVKK